MRSQLIKKIGLVVDTLREKEKRKTKGSNFIKNYAIKKDNKAIKLFDFKSPTRDETNENT